VRASYAHGVSGILVASGRYEQTSAQILVGRAPIGRRPDFSKQTTRTTYPAHVQLRLDEVGCDGAVRWTTTTTDDETLSSDYNRNVGRVIDETFFQAAHEAAGARAATTIFEPRPALQAPMNAAPPAVIAIYALLPYEQPGVADPHRSQITHSLFMRLQNKHLVVNAVPAMDHFGVFERGRNICTRTGAQAIIVPAFRLEQSDLTFSTHASLRLSLVSCSGTIIRQASAEADVKHAYTRNLDAAILDVSERAMDAVLTELFPGQPGATP